MYIVCMAPGPAPIHTNASAHAQVPCGQSLWDVHIDAFRQGEQAVAACCWRGFACGSFGDRHAVAAGSGCLVVANLAAAASKLELTERRPATHI